MQVLDDAHGQAAIDGQVFSGDVVVLHKIQDCAGYILRFAFAMERNPVLDIVLHLRRREHVLEGSANDPGRDAIHANIVLRQFPRQGRRQVSERRTQAEDEFRALAEKVRERAL